MEVDKCRKMKRCYNYEEIGNLITRMLQTEEGKEGKSKNSRGGKRGLIFP